MYEFDPRGMHGVGMGWWPYRGTAGPETYPGGIPCGASRTGRQICFPEDQQAFARQRGCQVTDLVCRTGTGLEGAVFCCPQGWETAAPGPGEGAGMTGLQWGLLAAAVAAVGVGGYMMWKKGERDDYEAFLATVREEG